MLMCILFIFMILIEFMVVTWLVRCHKKIQAEMIDRYVIVFLPLSFILFIIFYWLALFSHDLYCEYHQNNVIELGIL